MWKILVGDSMELIKAFNYMKVIINNGKKNDFSANNVKEGLEEYVYTLIKEKELTLSDSDVLFTIVENVDRIMKSKITADEIYVEALSKEANIDYEKCRNIRVKKKEEDIEYSSSKTNNDEGNPWDYLPVEPGTCGKTWDAQRKAQWDEMWNSSVKEKTGCGRYW